MANDTDHKLVSELMDSVQQRDGGRLPARRPEPAGGRRILDIVLWSSITNLMLLACFLAGWNFDELKTRFLPKTALAVIAASTDEPVPVSHLDLEDNELLTKGPQRQLKGPLQITMVPATEQPEPVTPPSDAGPDTAPDAIASVDAVAPEQDQGDGFGAGDIPVGPEDPAAQLSRSPVLRKGQKNGDVEIGSFATVSLPGSSGECLDTAYGLLEDAGAARDKLKVLAESKMITVARICADNGSLVVTCRMDQITISPRRLKPNETCTG